jgi:hypothetical protein
MNRMLWQVVLLGAALGFSQGAFAEAERPKSDSRWEEMKSKSPQERKGMRDDMRAKWDGMSEEEKEKFKQERKAKWDALSKEEKLKLIEEKRLEMKKHMDEKWNAMSADEKISFAEERMKRHGKHGGGDSRRGPKQMPKADD